MRTFFYTVASGAALFFLSPQAHAVIDIALQMQLGNPSGAITDTNNHNHYLIQRTVEAIDYSDNLGQPVWASWDLTTADVGSSGRSSTYYTDNTLPANFYHVSTTDYNGVGNIDFNRGHLCPSADRTDNTNDNKLVFYMSNIMPQSGPNNDGPWGSLEDYCRTQTNTSEMLIICGGSGFGTNTIPSGKAFIPSNTWKIAVFVPLGSNTALSRITAGDRVIAISIPNLTNGLSSSWQSYITSAGQIELATGFTFFTAVPANIATVFRAKIDGYAAPGITGFSPTNGNVGGTVIITGTNFTTASTVWFNGTNASYTVNSDTQITALVPAGAVSGPISVVTAGGLANSAANFAVVNGALNIQSSGFINGQFSFTVTGAVAGNYTVFATTDLTLTPWIPIFTTNTPGGIFIFTDTNTILPRQFYSVQMTP